MQRYGISFHTPFSTILALMLLAIPTSVKAGDVQVAVAANFTAAAKEIGALFGEKTPHRAIFSFASTGTLYTQISQGAPFDVFLAADRARPRKALDEGLAVADSDFTYAMGKIVLYSKDPSLVAGRETLTLGSFEKIALANPATAPYGGAAEQALSAMGLLDQIRPKFVQGKNIAQTYQFVATGNAELGFVALSQVAAHNDGSRWIVPANLYDPIRQDAVLLKHGKDNKAAHAFMTFLRGPEAATVKAKFGYGSGD